MTKRSKQVRLPELTIFKRYSLALRREFADGEEFLDAIERSYAEARAALGLGDGRLSPRSSSSGAADSKAGVSGPPGDSDKSGDATQSYLKTMFSDKDMFSEQESPGKPPAPAAPKTKAPVDLDAEFWGEKPKSGKSKDKYRANAGGADNVEEEDESGKEQKVRPASRKVVRVGRKGEIEDSSALKQLKKSGD